MWSTYLGIWGVGLLVTAGVGREGRRYSPSSPVTHTLTCLTVDSHRRLAREKKKSIEKSFDV